MAAHTVDAVGIIEGRSFFARADGLGGAVLYTDVAVDAVAVQDVWSHPDEGSNELNQEIRNHSNKSIGRKDEFGNGEAVQVLSQDFDLLK